MKSKRLTLSVLFVVAAVANALACTNLIVGKNASADGSTIVSYSADSYGLFGELYHYPAGMHKKGTLIDIHEWDTGKYLGQIEQARQTYNVIGNMNEFQLTIGETTFGGRPELWRVLHHRRPQRNMDYGDDWQGTRCARCRMGSCPRAR